MVKAVKSIESFAATLTKEVKLEDIKTLAVLDPTLEEAINKMMNWFDGKPMTIEEPWVKFNPNAYWVFSEPENIMVSSMGDFYSLTTNEIIIPRFVGGDLRIDINESTKRAAVIIAKNFRISSGNREGNMVIWFRDGDRRNLKVENITWKDSGSMKPVSTWDLLIEDICRRLIDCDGDINKTIEFYEGSDPVVKPSLIKSVLMKEKYSDISDRFFMMNEDNFIPMDELMTVEGDDTIVVSGDIGFDVSGFLIQSKDKELAKSLLIDKIKKGVNVLTEDEKTMIVFSAIENCGIDASVEDIQLTIRSIYGVSMPFDVISAIRKNGSTDIAEMYVK